MRRRFALVAGVGLTAAALAVWWRRQRTEPRPFSARFSWVLSLPGLEHTRTDLMLDRLGLEPGMRVLDAGAGPGRLSIPAAQRVAPGGEVVAADIQPAMLAQLTQRAAQAGVSNIRTLEAGLGQGALPQETFDRALLVAVLGEVHDREAALREIYDALRPGGVLSITEGFPDPHYQRADAVRELAQRVGFQVGETWSSRLGYTMHLVKQAQGE